MKRLLLPLIPFSLLLTGSQALLAREPVNTAPAPAPSEAEDEQLEPEVNIIQREDKTIEEYRVNGRLYMIKVIPKVGAPYFLVDNDGNGSFESRRADSALEPDIMIPNWVLFRW